MIVDMDDLMARQLTVTGTTDVTLGADAQTRLDPVRFTPEVDCESWRLELDGVWRVLRWPFPVKESELAAPGMCDADWETRVQPGKVFYADPHAECAPIPDWDRVKQTHLDPHDGAMLRRTVAIPAAWAGRRVLLRFDGIYPAARIFLDGVLLGQHLSGLTPVEYDVTAHVRPGRAVTVAVRLIRRHPHIQLDMPRHGNEFAGLAQGARFHAVEACHLAEHTLAATLDADCTQGCFAGEVAVRNGGNVPMQGHLALTLWDDTGREVTATRASVSVEAGGLTSVPLRLDVHAPHLWNDENPDLYRVRLRLEVFGQAEQSWSWQTGFRRLDLTPQGPRLNGRFIKFRGVNHLSFHPQGGLHTPVAWLRQNLQLMKKANVNAIRTHYLGPRELADLCDELGFYLIQELPIDWGTHYIHEPAWLGPILHRLEAGVRRDRAHVSVMVWSVGNENMPNTQAVADAGWNHLRGFDRFVKRLDPHRPTMFPPPGPANRIEGIFEVRVGDVADTHYSFKLARDFLATGSMQNPRSWEADMESTTRDEALARGWSGVWFSSEWGIHNMLPDLLNAPYNSIIDDTPEDPYSGRNSLQVAMDRLEREWGFMRAEPTCLGGAYFPWICAGAGDEPDGNPWGWVRWAEDADWGPVCADLTAKPFFWALRAAFSPVRFPARVAWQTGAEAFTLELDNQYNGVDFKDCRLRVQLNLGGRWMTMVRRYVEVPMSCPPGGRTTVTVPVDRHLREALDTGKTVMARCTFLDPRGFRPAQADVLVARDTDRASETAMPIGPDA